MSVRSSPTPPLTWTYHNLLAMEVVLRDSARELVKSRLPNYSSDHCAKLLGGSPYEYLSRCACDEEGDLLGVIAFAVGKLDTVEIVAFVSKTDGIGIGRFLMESFVTEMKTKSKSSILTYIEPSALAFFTRFSFTKNVPARSLYERITSKYVGATLMYRELLEPSSSFQEHNGIQVGDRLLVMVDGTLVPRQAQVKEVDMRLKKIFIHYYFWNPRHDEWIFPHSPRVRWDLPLPPEPPKHMGENKATAEQVKQLFAVELKKEKKEEIVLSNGSWPRGVKKGGSVQVKIEGNWVDAKVLEKSDEFLFCEFEYNGSQWQQDFPRESVRLGEGESTVLDALITRRNLCLRRRVEGRKRANRVIELTPPRPSLGRKKRPISILR